MKALKQPDTGILLFRIGIGLMYIFHGLPKLFAGPGKWEALGHAMGNIDITFLPVVWGFLASAAEFFGGMLILSGMAFRWAAFFIFFTMLIATLSKYYGGSGDFKEWSYPAEMAIVMFSFIFIGPGKHIFRFK
jgi:putative oxidoreductase